MQLCNYLYYKRSTGYLLLLLLLLLTARGRNIAIDRES